MPMATAVRPAAAAPALACRGNGAQENRRKMGGIRSKPYASDRTGAMPDDVFREKYRHEVDERRQC